jgi:hypothetical protein
MVVSAEPTNDAGLLKQIGAGGIGEVHSMANRAVRPARMLRQV